LPRTVASASRLRSARSSVLDGTGVIHPAGRSPPWFQLLRAVASHRGPVFLGPSALELASTGLRLRDRPHLLSSAFCQCALSASRLRSPSPLELSLRFFRFGSPTARRENVYLIVRFASQEQKRHV